MKKWKVLVLLGALLPSVSILFIEDWVPERGVVWNVSNGVVRIGTENSNELQCFLQRQVREVAKAAGETSLPSTPACGLTLVSVSYKWLVLIGAGLMVTGFILRGEKGRSRRFR
jgi:hypothetical protein